MRHLRIREGQTGHPPGRLARALAACMLALFALAALAASGASASLPEWGGCEPAGPGHGKYSDPACVKKVTLANKKTEGDYEWYTGESFGWVWEREHGGHFPFQLNGYTFGEMSTTQIGPSTFETAAHKKMQCEEGSIFLSLENANTKGVRNVFLSLRGCKSEGQPCYSNGFEAGEVTNENQWLDGEGLKGTLGFIKKGTETEPPEVGLSLTAFDTKSENLEQKHLLFATCEAPGPESVGNLEIGGNKKGGNYVIAVIKPIDQMATEHELTYTQSAGVQSPSAFQGKTSTGLMGFTESKWLPLGLETSATLRTEERFTPEEWTKVPPIEIKATP